MPIEVLTRSKTLPKISVKLCRVPIVVFELIGIEVGTNDAKGNTIEELTITFIDDEGVEVADLVAEEVTDSSVDEVLGSFVSNT